MKKIINWLFNIKKKEKEEENVIKCPNCKNTTFIEGAGGGSFGNIKCAKCNKQYNNLGIFGLQEIKINEKKI